LALAPSRPVVYASIGLLVLIWGTTWAAIRIGLEGIPPLTGLALRFAIASALLLALSPVLGVRLGRAPGERRLWLASALLNFCISYGILYWAEQWVPSGLTAVLFATFPLWTGLLAHLALPGERLTARALAGALVGFAGVAVIFSEDFRSLGGPQVAFAAAVTLLSPVASALGSVAVKRWGQGIHPLSLAAVPMGLTALVMGGVALLVERGRPAVFDARSVAALVYLAVFGSAVTFTVYYWLLKRLPATSLALITYATPVVAVAVGAAFLDEPFTLRILLGAALVIGGVAMAVRSRKPAALEKG
jgi:drug/metabolite transporter (DMT)-like permease